MDLNPRSTTPDMTRLPNSVQVWTAPIISFAHLFVLSISVLQLINQLFYLCDRPAFKIALDFQVQNVFFLDCPTMIALDFRIRRYGYFKFGLFMLEMSKNMC